MRPRPNEEALRPGMTVTNEPGYYEDGAFGIRVENVMIVKRVDTPFKFGDSDYLGFDTITFAPIQTKLLDLAVMSPAEVAWINAYHGQCREVLGPQLAGTSAYAYLMAETEPISAHLRA
jgi:Xaa-Pro aminopeptidase